MIHLGAVYTTVRARQSRSPNNVQGRAHLAEEAAPQDPAPSVEPVDDRVGILLHGGGKDNERVPLRDLRGGFRCCSA